MLVDIYPVTPDSGIRARAAVSGDVAGTFVAEYLVSDIQQDVDSALSVLSHLDAVQAGRETSWAVSGNAFYISVNANTAVLHFHWADEGQTDTVEVPVNEVREAIKAWIAALERRSVSTSS